MSDINVTVQDEIVEIDVIDTPVYVDVINSPGAAGPAGPGVAVGGTAGQILAKASATNYDTEWINNYAKYLATNVRNQTGSTIAAFRVVYISGATGNKPLVSLADADTEATSSKTYGVTSVSIANNGTGDVVTAGELSGIDTSAFTEGNSLWLSSTAGQVQTTPPAEPAHAVFIGTVVRSHPTLGIIDVAIQNGYELTELHGVEITSPANNDGLFYNGSLWVNKSIPTVLGYTPEQPLTFSSPLLRVGNVVSIPQATGSVNGFLSSTDWTTFNSKQNALGYTPANAATTLTINGVTFDLSANRSWTISTGISGSGASGQVTYWTGASAVGGSNNLFWDNTNSALAIGGTTIDTSIAIQVNSIKGIRISGAGGGIGYSIVRGIETTSIVNTGSLSYIIATNALVCNTGGVDRMRLHSTGNLVLGGTVSTDNGARLQVSGNVTVSGDINPSSITLPANGTIRYTTGSYRFQEFYDGGSASNSFLVAHPSVGVFNFGFGVSTAASIAGSSLFNFVLTRTGLFLRDTLSSTTNPNASSVLELSSTTRGFLPPRMTTTQKNAISSPAAGLVVYDTTLNKLCVYTTAWETITSV